MLRQTVPNANCGDRKGSVADIVDNRVQRTISDDEEAERRRRRAWKSVGCLKFVGKVRQCCSVLTRLDKESELEINSLPCFQPVQLVEEWSDVVVSDVITLTEQRIYHSLCWHYAYIALLVFSSVCAKLE